MEIMWLRVRAPFAAFRGFQAGVYRATAPVMPPSTAYGLILNLAGIEMRGPMTGVTTEIRDDLPKLRLAIGAISIDGRCSIYQQLHSYPVGASGKELSARTHGAKFWIIPVRRELLVDYDGMIGVQSEDTEILERVRRGLCGKLDLPRYGLPFLGDNNLLIDRLDLVDEPLSNTYWYALMKPDDPLRKGSSRLTVCINRKDNSRSTSFLYAPMERGMIQPPEDAWTWVPDKPTL